MSKMALWKKSWVLDVKRQQTQEHGKTLLAIQFCSSQPLFFDPISKRHIWTEFIESRDRVWQVENMPTELLPVELRYWPIKRYRDMYRKSLTDIEEFWEQEARDLEWFRTWDKVLDWNPLFAKWFPGGMLNACYLCVDRHLKTWRRNKVAIYWEGETGKERAPRRGGIFHL